MLLVDQLLSAFKSALREVNPSASVQKALSVRDGKLFVQNRAFELHKNVHLVAFGKAAPAMVQGAERVLGEHIRRGIASVPMKIDIPSGLKTEFCTGAEHNLPDERAVENTKRIEQFVSEANSAPDQLILFLVSGGGSALLTAPISGVSLNDKVALIRQVQNNGADIKQLNVVRTALSRVKGGGLAKLGRPSKMISLVISDIVGDPLELISSGPTIVSAKSYANPIAILNDLGILDKVPIRLVDALRSAHLEKDQYDPSPTDALNVIIASNSILLDNLANQINDCFNSLSISPFIVTNRLEGNATELGMRFAKLIKQSMVNGKLDRSMIADFDDDSQRSAEFDSQRVVVLFGGESTVRFDAKKATQNAKGGRNQEMVLSAFHHLAECWSDLPKETKSQCQFALFSIGSDGQDGPTDAAGAFLTNDDLEGLSENLQLASEIEQLLNSKCSYHFWSDYRNGKNLIKIGKTGVNVMDVQMLLLNFGRK
ncbi:hypothetical protein niasHT_024242 [Heterodera trifolii]|uniref:Glycerate kinase n=1 Tax=Heterodera trifolii TaxID=157864 RepID=A0ABD2JM66_9BILA